jgi:hypothetical protein
MPWHRTGTRGAPGTEPRQIAAGYFPSLWWLMVVKSRPVVDKERPFFSLIPFLILTPASALTLTKTPALKTSAKTRAFFFIFSPLDHSEIRYSVCVRRGESKQILCLRTTVTFHVFWWKFTKIVI